MGSGNTLHGYHNDKGHAIAHLSKLIEYTPHKVNYGLQVTVICQCEFQTTLMGDIDKGDAMHMREQ